MTQLSGSNYADTLKEMGLKLVEFSASWCSQCRALSPILEDLDKKYDDLCKFYTIDAEECEAASAEFDVRSLPLIVLMKDETVVWKNAGMTTKAIIEEKIKENL